MFDWGEYLKLAKTLLDIDSQAALRSAVSRSYYSAYHCAGDYARAHGYDGQINHQPIIDWFKEPGRTKEERAIGLALQDLKDMRVNPDYYARATLTKKTCNSHVKDVAKFLSLPIWT